MATLPASDASHVKMQAALRHAQVKALSSLVKNTDASAVSEQDLARRLQQRIDVVEDLTNYCWHQRKANDDWYQPRFVAKSLADFCRNTARQFSEGEVESIARQALLALAVLEAELRFFPGVHGEPVSSSITGPQVPSSTDDA